MTEENARAEALLSLAKELQLAKELEKDAKARRELAEAMFLSAVGFTKPEGSTTYTIEAPSGTAKVECSQPVYSSVDAAAWRKLRRTLDKDHAGRACFVQKYDLAVGAARKLQKEDPQAWATVAAVVRRRPGKTAAAVKKIQENPQPEE